MDHLQQRQSAADRCQPAGAGPQNHKFRLGVSCLPSGMGLSPPGTRWPCLGYCHPPIFFLPGGRVHLMPYLVAKANPDSLVHAPPSLHFVVCSQAQPEYRAQARARRPLLSAAHRRQPVDELRRAHHHRTPAAHRPTRLRRAPLLPAGRFSGPTHRRSRPHYLWLIGSHSLKQPDENDIDTAKQIAKLTKTKTKADPNRYLLARVPLLRNAATGEYELHKKAPHPTAPDQTLRAAQLHGNGNN